MAGRIQTIADVARWRLCCGCGMCVPACSNRAIHLIDVEDQGLRPVVDPAKCERCGRCLQVCPGWELQADALADGAVAELADEWGSVLEVWEGYAADPEIRFQGSSGGAVTALSLFCIEKLGFAGALHVGPSPEHPLVNVAGISRDRRDLLRLAGSRYAPAAPCVGIDQLEPADTPYLFVGKPCDVAAVRKWQRLDPVRRNLIGLTVSIFCAGTPSTQGTMKILERLGTRPDEVAEFRYRGWGWPGEAVARLKSPAQGPASASPVESRRMSYAQAWGEILTGYVCLRCRLCPDSTGQFADLSCGDPWYRGTNSTDPGQSLVLVRTDIGRDVLHQAMEAGYLHLQRSPAAILPASQLSPLEKRRQLWGRLATMSAMHVPVPRYEGFPLFRNWRRLPFMEKARSLLGTARRVVTRRLYKPLEVLHVDTSQAPVPEARR